MKKAVLILLLLLNGLRLLAQTTDRSRFLTDSLDSYVNKALAAWHIPGAAVGIIKDGKIVIMKGYGVRQIGLPATVDTNTLFLIGSNTGAFTATALAMLEEEGKLKLNDKVRKFLPGCKLSDAALSQAVTIRDLLAQRVGFGSSQGAFTYWNSNLSRKQVIKKLSSINPANGFREKWGYTDATYLIAGEVLAAVAGKSWDQQVQERLFRPLGMTTTVTSTAGITKASNKAAGHLLNDGLLMGVGYPVLDNIAPATGIMTSIRDMGKWVATLLADGKAGGKKVIPVEAIRSTMLPVMYVGSYRRPTGEMCINLDGLGWFYQNFGGRVLLLRDDVGSGFTSIVNLVPEEKLGIIVFTNSQTNFFHEALALEILDVYAKRPYQDYSARFAADMRSQNETESEYLTTMNVNTRLHDTVALQLQPALEPDSYTGRYENRLYGNVVVERDKKHALVMHFEHHPHLSAQLHPLGGNRFYAVYSDPLFGRFVFPFDVQKGKVTGVAVSVAIESYPYHFKKLP